MRKRLIASLVAATVLIGGAMAAPAVAKTNLKGAGSSFANKFITSCAVKSANYSVTYNPAGSGTGRSAFGNGSVAFGASDAASSITLSGSRAGGAYTYIPVVGGPIAILFNVPGITNGKLKLDASTWAKILTGKVKMWNDGAIKSLQTPAIQAKLPAKPIRVVYRASNSGTSENMTNYLRQVAPAIWTRPKNGTIANGNPAGRMPAGSIGAPNSASLVTSVKSVSYSIGYADLSDTVDASGNPKVAVAALKNQNNEFVVPSSTSSAKFLEVFNTRKYFNATTGAVNLNFATNIPGAYNMSLLTYAIADKNSTSATAASVEEFVSYLLTDCGPSYAASLGYAPISGELKTKALALAAAIRQ